MAVKKIRKNATQKLPETMSPAIILSKVEDRQRTRRMTLSLFKERLAWVKVRFIVFDKTKPFNLI